MDGRRKVTCRRSGWSKEQRLGSGERPKAPETETEAGRAGDAMRGAAGIGAAAAELGFASSGGGGVLLRRGREATRKLVGLGAVEAKVKEGGVKAAND
jgi:hypothetical protein